MEKINIKAAKENLICCGKQLVELIKRLIGEKTQQISPEEERESYLRNVDRAREEWQQALQNFDYYMGRDLIDFGVYQINAAEKKYIHLLNEARNHNIKAEQLHVVS